MKVKPRGIEIPLIVLISLLSVFVVGTLGLLIYRLSQTGVFEQETVAQTDVVTTKRVASLTTAPADAGDAAETETTAKEETTEAVATEADTTAAETEKETTAATTATTKAATTKPAETKAPETKPATTKAAETKPAKTEKAEQKPATTKAEGEKGGKTTTKAEETDPVAIYQKYVKDELIPKYGMAPVGEGKRPENGKGLASVLLRDFGNSGELEMLVIRLEDYSSVCSVYPVFMLYGIKDGEVHKLGERSCDYAMSEWNIRLEGGKVFLRSKMSDVNGSEADLRINQVDIGLANHNVVITTDSYTIGDPNGPAMTCSDNALWVAELGNEVKDANLLNEGRVYTLTDYTGLRDWVK